MNFFNIDLHISVIADIKKIFNDLGHEVDVNYLSNHAWVFKQSPNNNFVVNQSNWMNIDKKMCDTFYEQNKIKFEKYDGFIVTHIPALSLLYEKFNKPIIFVASTRYEHPFTNDINRWKWFNEYINNNDNIITVANNLYDKWYCEQFLNKEFKHIPSYCDYTNVKYNKSSNLNILYSKRYNISDENIINKNSLGRYEWSDIFKYNSIIHIPYNVSTMSIFEQYTANVPMFFPSKKNLYRMTMDNMALTEISYSQVFGTKQKSIVHYKDMDPNKISNELINKSIELSDFYNDDMKYLLYFNDIDDLKNKIKNIDTNEVSIKMSEHNVVRKENIYKNWKKIIDTL